MNEINFFGWNCKRRCIRVQWPGCPVSKVLPYPFSVDILPELTAVLWLLNFALTTASSLWPVLRNVTLSHMVHLWTF